MNTSKSTPKRPPQTLNEIIGNEATMIDVAINHKTNMLRCAIPGSIIDFDPSNQTATVQIMIKEKAFGEWHTITPLLDVPVVFPRSGGYALTFPVKQGDECLVIFNDMCIDVVAFL